METAALGDSLNEVVRRHEVLRTVFATADDEPAQLVFAQRHLDLPVIDLTRLPYEVEELVQLLISEDTLRPFKLTHWPLFRAVLGVLGDLDYVLIFNMHHIVSDGWSVGILKREIASLYAAFSAGAPSHLPDLEIQYGDFAVWQRDWLGSPAAAVDLDYWKAQLRGPLPIMELPSGRSRPLVQTSRGESITVILPSSSAEALNLFCRREGVTLFMVLLAAFKILLHRYTGEHDLIVGTPIANRNRAEVEPLIGFFLNTLVLRTNLSGDPSFVQLLNRVRRVALEAYSHQDIPFEKLVEELKPERNLSRPPLFQIMFNMLNVGDEVFMLPGLSIADMEVPETRSKFDLTLYAAEEDGELSLTAVFSTDVLDRCTMERALLHLRNLLLSAPLNRSQRIQALPLEGANESKQICSGPGCETRPGDSTQSDEQDPGKSIWDQFEGQVEKYPSSIAISVDSDQWSYEHLGDRATRIAEAILNEFGFQENRIAILFETGAPMISALLGLLAAGKTYVPLEPAYPEERLRYILRDSQANAILTDNRDLELANRLAGSALSIINIDSLPSNITGVNMRTLSSASIAYILYTSGSTGTPKGVFQNQRNVLHHIATYIDSIRINPEDRLSLLSSYSFDAAVMDTFGALLTGATLCPMRLKVDGVVRLPEWLIEQSITIYHSTPTVYRYFAGTLTPMNRFPGVRVVVLGGEEVIKDDVEVYRRHFSPNCTFVNGLGPTESTLALQRFVDHAESMTRDSVPVGYPVKGSSVTLTTNAGRQLAIYGTGEIQISSSHVALGYWRQPDLSAAAFSPEPEDPHKALYRTGDLGRLLPDGSIEYVGRIDQQVKIRGFRVELAEIEAVLSQHPNVAKAVVVSGPVGRDHKLVAHLVPCRSPWPSAHELAAFSRAKLPDYMVPAAFHVVDVLPLTPSGKVDHRTLVRWSAGQENLEDTHPQEFGALGISLQRRTPVQEIVAGIVAEVLGISAVNDSGNFFDMGGHSLLAMLVVSRVRAAFGVDLPLRAFFESPTILGLSGLIESATLRRLGGLPLPTGEIARSAIKQSSPTSAGEDDAASRFTLFGRTGESRHFPVSFAQRRLYFLERLQPGASVYNIPTAVKLSGNLNLAALDRSLVEVVNRHGSLRTSFLLRDGEPIQVVGPEQSSQLGLVDLHALPPEERERKSSALAEEETRRPFDLENGALLRTRLVRLDPDNQLLLFTMHHIVSDGWSVGIFARDVAGLYEACSAGSTHKLKALPMDYTDFAVGERGWFESKRSDLQLDYWTKQLAGAPAVLSLPLDRPRPTIRTFRGARQFRALPLDLSQELQRLSRQQRVTLFMTLLAGFSTLLSRYSAQDDLIVGTPIAGRNQPEIEDLIGLFVNTLALRIDLSNDPAFSSLLERVRQVALAAYAHQELPFDKLVEELHPEREPGRQPLVQVMFVLQNLPEPELNMPGIDIAAVYLEGDTAKFDLTLSLRESESGLIAAVEYNCDLLDSTTVQRMIEQYHLLLEKVVKDPACPIRQVQLLVETARHQVLYEWNQPLAGSASRNCIHELFESQARQRPDSIAVVSEEESLTYAELNGRANQLAHYLRKSGVVAESPVGLRLERGLEMVVAITAVLKAGGTYVPLDASYPIDRLGYLVRDSRSRHVLTQVRLASDLPNYDGHIIHLDSDWSFVEQESRDNPCSLTTPGNTSYLIYTSGSTGNPKGVPVTHANVGRLFTATGKGFRFDYEDVWTLFHSHSFDFSVWEVWGALLFGGRLVVVPYLVSRSPQSFYELVSRERVTVLNQTPSAFRHFVDASAQQNASLSLRMVIFGGEALDPSSLIPWMVVHGDRYPQFVNMYGITETTVHVTSYTVTGHDVFSTQRSLIGRPISDLDLYILDDCLQLSPIGVVGEIHVGGAGLARGYLDRPSLAAERFVANPFSSMPGARLYRTGDLGRRLPDGQIEYVGRRDDQVKIRGFRVELGEIEALLASARSVREAVVVARETELAERQLIAYLVLAKGARSPLKDLRSLLRQKLPDYMMPASFVVLDHLPLTSNGKVDRAHLPRPDRTRPELEQTFVPPSTAEERDMTGIWKQVLDIETVGVADNFFALGGDSIRSIRVKALADERGLGFSLEDLFQNPTIRDLTKAIRANNNGDGSHERPGKFRLLKEHDRLMLPEGLLDAYPLARLQSGMLFHGEYNSKSVYHDVFSFHLKLEFDQEALRRAAQELINRHDVLRTTIDTSSFSEPLQLVRERSEAALSVKDLRHMDPQEQETAIRDWIARETMRPFDLMHGPLLRFRAHLRTHATFQFTVSFHHAILDGWSNASMLAESLHRYQLILGKRSDPVPPAPKVLYRDFVAAERQSIQSDDTRKYWTENLKGSSVSSLPRWPRQLRHSDVSDSSSDTQEVLLPTEMCQRLHQMARDLGVPLKSILLAAHLRVLSIMTGQIDVTTGVITNGRPEELDGDRVLGLFLNTVPFRFQLTAATWLDLVTGVFEAERRLFPFRRFPLAEVQRILGSYALFETIFNYVQFHIYDLIEGQGVEVLGKRSFEEMELPFVVYFSPAEPAIFLRINYHVSEFSKEQIDAIGRYYLSALTAIAEGPEGRYDAWLLLPVEERQLLLSDYDGAPAERAAVHDLFSAVAEQMPEAIALIFQDQLLTYGGLHYRSNRLARMLRRIGVRADRPVGICLERSFNTVIAVLATLKAGGACMPIDPVYPRQRISFLLEDSEVAFLLTQAELAARFPETRARVICLDRDNGGSIAHDNQDDLHKSTPSESAYVIYTSGSTGKPKGVVQTHECLSNLAGWQISSSPEAKRTLQYASLSFDVSFQEIFSTLCCGGRLYLMAESERVDMAELGRLIEDNRVQRFHIPNVVLEKLSERFAEDPTPLLSLQELMVGGEKLQITEPVARLFGNLGHCRLYNHYGPSETHVITSYRLPADVSRWPMVPPIGTRIAESRTLVLDSKMMPAPVGVEGELYLGGSALARGYLNRADLTAERFYPDPYSQEPGARFYRTGDLARVLPDRNLDFIGRNDYQIKIRGHRVELAEIETALYQSAGIREAVATLAEGKPGDKRILAYVALNGDGDFDVDELRTSLKERFPGYMVPSTFVLVDSLPRTANGKVDRSALPTPNSVPAETRKRSSLPRGPIEAELAAIWRELLGVESVGADDDFFDLGGHSLLATQLISRVRKVFAIEVPLRNIFVSRTLTDFARIVRDTMHGEPRAASERIESAPHGAGILPSFAQERMWFLDRLDPGSFAYILPFAVRLTGALDTQALEQCLSEIVRRHEALRTRFPRVGDRPIQDIAPATNLTLDRIDLSGMSRSVVDAQSRLLGASV
ncbi:MAG TPA: amino acid adenylation domain-containing protein, partial [Blastocatellia bacterium]|nr:amino acid adenylation domain-containing protein [Blastocatellia bacterium]